jgi:chromosome segregation ATPase
MTKMKRTIVVPAVLVMAVSLCGCQSQNRKTGTTNPQAVAASASPNSAARRFQDTPLEGKTVVQSAMELSEKYASLSDQATAMRQENQKLASENEELKRQIAAAETKLRQTQKELGEANQLLIEMLSELNNWKTNILGFRGEMREAAKAQLEAMLKVIEILGGEGQASTLKLQSEPLLRSDQAGPQASGPIISKGKDKDQNEP